MHRPNVCVLYSITTRSVKRWAWWMRREWQIPSYWSTPASTETSLSLWTTVQRSLEPVCAAAAAYFTVSVSVFTAIFQVDLGYPVCLLKQRMMEVVGAVGTIGRANCKAPVKSSPPTNQHPAFLHAGCPSCRPTNSVRSNHWREKYHFPWTCLPQPHLGVVQLLSLTTNSSWLPWGRVFMPLISPLMPVPHAAYFTIHYIIQHFTVKGA